MFDARWLKDGDYEGILLGWWKDWGIVAPPKDMLPNDGMGGIIISKNGVDICSAFLYISNSKVCFVEFVVTNYHYREKDRKSAIEELINVLTLLGKDEGAEYVFACVKNSPLLSKYMNCGFLKGAESVTELIKIIK